ncbi:MAG: hypothetical protein WBP72_12990 [Rhodocyclaceae bacterium]|jgi:hypothetical protein
MDPLIPAIVSAVIQTVMSSPSSEPSPPVAQVLRTIPAEAVLADMEPPSSGKVALNGQSFALTPATQIRDQRNLIVMSATVQQAAKVRYLPDLGGGVQRIWILTPQEVANASQ